MEINIVCFFFFQEMQFTIADGIAKGMIRPLNRLVYSPTEVHRAFRVLSLKKFGGKVLIRMRDPQASSTQLAVTPRYLWWFRFCTASLVASAIADGEALFALECIKKTSIFIMSGDSRKADAVVSFHWLKARNVSYCPLPEMRYLLMKKTF